MNVRKGFILYCFILAANLLAAQQTTIFTEATSTYKRGVELFDQGVYGLAQKEFFQTMTALRPVNEPEWRDLKTNAALYHVRCAVRLDQPEAEKLALDFLRDNAPSPVAGQAALEIGDFYFNKKAYDKALLYYDMAPSGSGAIREEIRFKQGYALFVTKKFGQAKSIFAGLKENQRGKYYDQSNYYYGCCAFYEGRYDEAMRAFQRCEQTDRYRAVVPYYLTQIYFAKKQYDQLIAYAEPKANDANQRNRTEINMLVGQAYFEKQDFAKAQKYMEYAANNGYAFRPGDYYQLGYAQYKNGYYKPAISNLEQLTKQDSLLGQNGLYHLGDCYVRTNNKFAARNAFGQAASLNYDKSVKEDALMNYAKLSYELKYDRDALDALQKFSTTSPYYDDAQALMGEIFLNTRDYDRAITTLEGVKTRSPRLNEIYQKVCYYRGIQLYQGNQRDEAARYFNKSLDHPLDRRIATLCSFWLGNIAHEKGDYKASKNHLAGFISNAKGYSDLPDESSVYMGQYVQGYNHLKLDNYADALSNFKLSVDGIKRNQANIESDQIKVAVLGDAVLRAGDCHFKKNQYGDALSYYNEAVSRKYDGFEYALYQKAIIKGLQGNNNDKIAALEDLVSKYPKSEFTDDALLELGQTYSGMGSNRPAVTALRRLVQDFRGKSPLVNQGLLQLGIISYNDGNPNAAIDYYKQVFANSPEKDEAQQALVAMEEIYKEQGRVDEYFTFVSTIPGYNVSNAAKDSVTYQSAEIQFQQGRYQQAVDGFTKYLTTYPTGREALSAYYYRAESYVKLNRNDMALKDYIAVTSKGPSRHYPKAAEKGSFIAFTQIKDYGQAFELARKWEESATSASSRAEAQVVAMESAYLSKNNAAVLEYANKVAANGSASSEQQSIANYYMGKSAYDRGDNDKAYTYLSHVVKATQSERMAESYHLMANILYRKRLYAQAEQLISDANQASAGYDDWIARNLILLSDVYADQGDVNNATAALEVVMENYKGNDSTIINTARQKYQKLGGVPPQQYNAPQKRQPDVLEFEGGN